MESTISQGDLMVDPFYILDIQKINIGNDVSFSHMFYYIIDNDKLNKYITWKKKHPDFIGHSKMSNQRKNLMVKV
jgi:hypothetical protein